MKTERVMYPKQVHKGDILMIVYNQMDVCNQTEIGYKGEFTRIWFTNDDVKQYVDNSEILTVIDESTDGGIICETLDKELIFSLPINWMADKRDEYLIFKIIKG